MGRRTGSDNNTIQAQEIFSVGFNLPAFVAETMCTIGSVFRLQLVIGQIGRAKSVCGIRYLHCASFDLY